MLIIDKCYYVISAIFIVGTIIGLFGFWWSRSIVESCKNTLRMIQLASKLPGPPTFPMIGNALKLACYPDSNKIL